MTQQPIQPPQYDYETIDDLRRHTNDGIRALIFSPPKHGKTALSLTFPTPTVVDFDGLGVKAALSPWFRRSFPKQLEPGVIRYKTFEEKIDDYGIANEPTAFWNGIKWINQILRDPTRKTIVIDSLTALTKYAALVGMVANKKRGRSKSWDHKNTDHLIIQTEGDFGAEMAAMEQLFDQLMTVKDKNIIAIAHERTEQSDSGVTVARMPLLTGNRLRSAIARWFDEVWYLDTDRQGKRILYCQPFGVLKGVGSRLGLPQTIEDPSYDKIIKLIKEAA